MLLNMEIGRLRRLPGCNNTHGNNFFEQNKVKFNEKKDAALAEILPQVGFIK